jgi:hypothetical protein
MECQRSSRLTHSNSEEGCYGKTVSHGLEMGIAQSFYGHQCPIKPPPPLLKKVDGMEK